MVKLDALKDAPGSLGVGLLAGLLSIAIFAIDTYAPLGIAVAVLYILVILLTASFASRETTVVVAAGCGVLAVVSYLLQHGLTFEAPFARLVMSLSAIAITGLLTYRNQTAQLKLRLAEKELRDILNATPAMFMRTRPDGTVDFMNAHWKARGFSETDLASNWLGLVHPDDAADMAAKRARSVATGEGFDAEFRLRRTDGVYRWLLSRVVAAHDETGKIVARYVAATDIEERRRAEAALHQAQVELAHVTRMTSLGELTTSIAHEVNQPLAAIMTNGDVALRLLDMTPPDVAEAKEATRAVVSNARRASEIIKRIRALARKAEPERAPLDLNDAIEDVAQLLKGEALRHRLALRLELAPGLPRVTGDRVELQQVLMNLILNGMEAMSAGPDEGREVVVRTRRDANNDVIVEVSDLGGGIDAANADQIFNAFYTTKANGMGMGLAICRSIIESHGGQISARNDTGRGATVQFALPADQEAHV